jgi:hypothetical protein
LGTAGSCEIRSNYLLFGFFCHIDRAAEPRFQDGFRELAEFAPTPFVVAAGSAAAPREGNITQIA